MTLETIVSIGIAIVTGLVTIIAYPCIYIVRSVMQRIENLEKETKTKINEKDVRILLNDHLTPLKEDLVEIKQAQQVILNHIISKK